MKIVCQKAVTVAILCLNNYFMMIKSEDDIRDIGLKLFSAIISIELTSELMEQLIELSFCEGYWQAICQEHFLLN